MKGIFYIEMKNEEVYRWYNFSEPAAHVIADVEHTK